MRILTLAAAVLLTAVPHILSAEKVTPLAIGEKAPDFKLQGVDDKTYTLADFANPDSPAYTMMGGGGYDYRPQARGGGTNNITVNTSTNATPSEITDAVVWGLQVSGVN